MKTMKSKIFPIAIAVAVFICMFAVPVSAASSSGYFNSGTIYIDQFKYNDDFALRDPFEAVFVDQGNYLEFNQNGLAFPELYDWSTYMLTIPISETTINPGDDITLEFNLEYYSNLPLFRRDFMFETISGSGSINYVMSVEPLPDVSVDGWPSYSSLRLHHLHFSLKLSSSVTTTFDSFTFNFELYRSSSDAPMFLIYSLTSYRIYGGDPNSPGFPKYENPSNGELGDASGNLTEKEDELNDALTDSQSKADEPFKAFSLSTFQDGLGCWVTLFNHILPSSLWLYNLINISLSLGLFAFVVGMATVVVRSVSRNRGGKGDS